MGRTRLELVLAAAVGGAAALALQQPVQGQGAAPALVRGGGSAGVEKEPIYRFNTLKNTASTVQFDRNVLVVPSSYGRLVAVTMAQRKPVLWYEDSAGDVRNVVLQDAESLVRLNRQASQ